MTARILTHADPPFAPGPTTRFYCPVPALETTFEAMVLATVGRRPVTLLIGPPGSGKTTLLQRLINHWSESGCLLLAVSASPEMDVETLIEGGARGGIGHASGLDDLVDMLERRLDESGTGLLVVDDAHRLSPDVLAEMVELAGSRTDAGNYLQIILGGGPALAEALAAVLDGPLDAFVATCTVPPLPPDQIADLIRHRLSVVGETGGHPFTPGAIGALAEAAKGRPGAAVGMAATVLDTAEARGVDRVDAALVRDVMAPGRGVARRQGPPDERPSRRTDPTPADPPPPSSAPAAWQAPGSDGLSGGPSRPRRDTGVRPRSEGRRRGGRWTTLLLVLMLAAGGAWAGVEYAERIGVALPGLPAAPPTTSRPEAATTVPILPAPLSPPLPAASLPTAPPLAASTEPAAPPPAVPPLQPDPRDGRIRSLVLRADRQIEQKKLTTPPGDNALDTVREIEGFAPGHESVGRLRAQIAETYVRWGRQAEARRQVDDARRFYTRAIQAAPDNGAARDLLVGLDGRGSTQDEVAVPPGGSPDAATTAPLPPTATGGALPGFVQPIDFIGPEALIEALDKPDILRAVIGAGRDFDRPLPDGRTPLMVAAATGRTVAIRILLEEAKVGVDRRDPAGWTALMYAATTGQAEAARLLLAAGADRSPRNNAGQSAQEMGLTVPRGPLNLSQRR